MREDRPGFAFGYGLAGLLAAGAAYYAFGAGLFSGPPWRGLLTSIAIGGGSAFLLIGLERLIWGSKPGGGSKRPVKLKGDWACPSCGAAYVATATDCSDCHVPLVRRDDARSAE
jgi:hypothetical protein